MNGKVKKVVEAPMPHWMLIEIEGQDKPLAVSYNWFGEQNELGLPVPKEGDLIEYDFVAAHYSNYPYYQYVKNLRLIRE